MSAEDRLQYYLDEGYDREMAEAMAEADQLKEILYGKRQ